MGDHYTTENGDDVQFVTRRKPTPTPPRVITLRDALVVAGTCTTLFGGIVIFSLRSLVREEIGFHDQNSRAHTAIMEPVRDHMSRQNGEEAQNREMYARIRSMETQLQESGRSIARIEARLEPKRDKAR